MIEQVQAKLEKTQVTAIRAMDDLDPIIPLSNDTQVNDPDISQASGDHQACQTHWVRDLAFVQMEAPALLVGEEGSDAKAFGIPVTSFFGQLHIGGQVNRLFVAGFPPSDGQHWTISNEAIQRALESVRIGEEINNLTIGSYGGAALALAYLFADNLPAARSAAETACQYNEPLHKHYALRLLGLIGLRQGDRTTAPGAFAEALNEADSLLPRTSQNYDALDSIGLALCGLALLEEDPKTLARPGWVREDLSGLATQAYRAARVINADPGVVGRVVRLLDALVLADPAGAEILADARAAVAGE
jgi:hypothetical protein